MNNILWNANKDADYVKVWKMFQTGSATLATEIGTSDRRSLST